MTGVSCYQPLPRIQNWLVVGLIALVGSLSPAAQAEKADRQAPTNIDSDKLDHDDKTKRTIFTGNVVLTKVALDR